MTGLGQSGKTTLAKACFPEKPYLSLEDPDIARLAREDPRGLLDTYRDGLVLDMVKGFYPPLYDREVGPYDWYTNYLAPYVERDVRSILNVKDLGQFQTFVLYFIDTGLAARVLGIKSMEELFVHPNRGNLFESFVVAEVLKKRYSSGFDPDIFFWRDNIGTEASACALVYAGDRALKWKELSIVPWLEVAGILDTAWA